ncbi:hypothetical protein INS49_015618 [Diaporthe citri]|uniref:uncharacterized protein n=1 Tax=Diaporthe citri TaxID=83186 RepID=UPI001C810372|nr:uncharacterized protein INS49_015618 [Diaporthe citri]KAG6356231.1 hypothetical protein INS49_015618 [Diaporthe citri]
MQPAGERLNFWELLAVVRLFGNCVDIRTSVLLDGGIFCASGTTAAYKSSIVQDPTFQSYFLTETFLGSKVHAGDDQSISFWLCQQGRYPYTAQYEFMWCVETFTPVWEAICIAGVESPRRKLLLLVIIAASRLVRYIPDVIHDWKRMALLPMITIYLYILELVKIHALLTLSVVSQLRLLQR